MTEYYIKSLENVSLKLSNFIAYTVFTLTALGH